MAEEVGMSQVSCGVEVSPGMVDLASYNEGDMAGAHHSVRIYDSNVDNIETLYRLRRVSGRPADYT